MKSRNTLATQIVACSTLSLGIIGSVWVIRIADMSLIRKGHRIGRLNGQADGFVPEPEWVSSNVAIFLSYRADGDKFEFNRLNADTGSQAPIPALNNRLGSALKSITFKRILNSVDSEESIHLAPRFSLNHGNSRLLIAPELAPARTSTYHVTNIGGTIDIQLRGAAGYQAPLWLNNDNQFILPNDLTNTSRVLEYDLTNPSSYRVRDTHIPDVQPSIGHLNVTFQNLIWGINLDKENTGTVLIAQWAVADVTKPRIFRARLPVAGDLRDARVAPDSDRVAWLLTYDYTSPVLERIHRIINAVKVKQSQRYSIWVSKLDGTQMEEVGHEDMTNWKSFSGYIRWTPDGKKLAVYLGSELYLIPV